MSTRSASSSGPTRANCGCTATGSSGPPRTPRTRCRRPCWPPGAAWPVRGAVLGPDLAVPGRHQLLPQVAALSQQAPAGELAATRGGPTPAQPDGRGDLAAALPRHAAGRARRRHPPARRQIRGRRSHLPGLRHRPADLPPRQRAVLILRDVLGFPTSQVAGILDSSEDPAASALKRARAAMRDQFPPATARPLPPRPGSAGERDLVDRFTRAYQAGDVACRRRPAHRGHRGDHAAAFAGVPRPRPGRQVHRRHRAPPRTQAPPHPDPGERPARVRLYVQDPQAGIFHATGMLVLTLTGGTICAMTGFDTSSLPQFGLPRTLPGCLPGDPCEQPASAGGVVHKLPRRPAQGADRQFDGTRCLERHHASGPQRVHLLGSTMPSRRRPGNAAFAGPRRSWRKAASALLLAGMQAPRAHRQIVAAHRRQTVVRPFTAHVSPIPAHGQRPDAPNGAIRTYRGRCSPARSSSTSRRGS